MRVDSHQHFWKYNTGMDSWINDDMRILRRNFLPGDLMPVLHGNGIDGCVAVQADQSEDETDFLLSLASENPFILGVVGWVDLRSKNLETRLQHFKAFQKLKGFRHIVQAEPAGFLEDENFIRGVNTLASFGFTYDLLVYHYQLEEACDFLTKTNVKIVLDHLGKPAIRDKQIVDWSENIKRLASFDHVYCKLSGLVTEADWTNWKEDDIFPYLEIVLKEFGDTRLMYGSDWPVCLLAGTYETQLQVIDSFVATLPLASQEKIFGENAIRFYNL
jgi:L-fuconolactonase